MYVFTTGSEVVGGENSHIDDQVDDQVKSAPSTVGRGTGYGIINRSSNTPSL